MKSTAGPDRALFWTFAVAAFAVAAAGLAARAVDRLAIRYESDRVNYAIVQVTAPEGDTGMALATGALEHAPHVTGAAPMTQRRAAQLLAQLGAPAPAISADMPPLRLIEIDLDAGSAQADVSGDIEAALAQSGVTARVIRPPSAGAAGGLAFDARNIALWTAGLFAAVMALLISLAARGFAARRTDFVSVLADLGATAPQAGARVGDEAAALGLRAGIVGAFVAGAIAVGMLLVLAPDVSWRALPNVLVPLDAAPLLIAPLLAAVAAGMGARAGAESVHAQAARLA